MNFLRNLKLARNLCLFGGVGLLISVILKALDNDSTILLIIDLLLCILSFTSAYVYHKKIDKHNKN